MAQKTIIPYIEGDTFITEKELTLKGFRLLQSTIYTINNIYDIKGRYHVNISSKSGTSTYYNTIPLYLLQAKFIKKQDHYDLLEKHLQLLNQIK